MPSSSLDLTSTISSESPSPPTSAQEEHHTVVPPVITTSHITTNNPEQLPLGYVEFEDVFSEANADRLPPRRPGFDCAIDLIEGAEPPYGPVYPLSRDEEALVQEHHTINNKRGFTRNSTSSAGAPVFFVDKPKDPKVSNKVPPKRLVNDYVGLDKVTKKFKYPLPLISELFDHLHAAKIFTKIDLRSAFHQLRIKEGDEWKTAFRTKYGLYEYLDMLFGLANAPAYFQRFVNEVFKDMIGKLVVISTWTIS
jgi:hypothetical protein